MVAHEERKAARQVLLAGATGLVGREILKLLLADPSIARIHTLGRRAPLIPPGGASHDARVQHHASDLRDIPPLPALHAGFIALGTTIKVAGSQAAFRAVDHDAVLAVARAMQAAGARTLGVVSAMGADAQSRIFYNRVKGETEEALAMQGFECLVVARPSLLLGDRASLGQPLRQGEGLGARLSRWLRPIIPADYRAIRAQDVAQALVQTVARAEPGRHVLRSGQMQPVQQTS